MTGSVVSSPLPPHVAAEVQAILNGVACQRLADRLGVPLTAVRPAGRSTDKTTTPEPTPHAPKATVAAPRQPLAKSSGVYFIASRRLVKVGRSIDIEARLKTLQASSPEHLRLARTIQCSNSEATQGRVERWLHDRFAVSRRHGEWFDVGVLDDPILDLLDEEILDLSGVAPVDVAAA